MRIGWTNNKKSTWNLKAAYTFQRKMNERENVWTKISFQSIDVKCWIFRINKYIHSNQWTIISEQALKHRLLTTKCISRESRLWTMWLEIVHSDNGIHFASICARFSISIIHYLSFLSFGIAFFWINQLSVMWELETGTQSNSKKLLHFLRAHFVDSKTGNRQQLYS